MLDALKKTKHRFLVLAASSHGLFLLQMTCSQKQGLSPSLEQKGTLCLISDQREWLSCKDGPYTNWEELLSAGKISSRKFLSSGEGMERLVSDIPGPPWYRWPYGTSSTGR